MVPYKAIVLFDHTPILLQLAFILKQTYTHSTGQI